MFPQRRPRPRLGQLPRGDARQGDLPTCDRPPGIMFLLALVLQINRTRSFAPRPNSAVDILAAPEPCYFRWFNKAKMTWSPPPVFRGRLVRGFEGFGQVLLLVGEEMAVSVDGDLDA
jgi:hypothetical protein